MLIGRHHWYVWDEQDNVLCEGSYAICYRFYKRGGGMAKNLHLGYLIPEPKKSNRMSQENGKEDHATH